VRKKRPDLKIEGPIQYDAAVDMEVGQSKMPNSEWQDRQVCLFSGFKYRKQHVKAVQEKREHWPLAMLQVNKRKDSGCSR
jgi:phosphate acetyltransferase